MARVKSGPYGHRRHKKVLKYTKGQKGSKHLLYRRANEAMLKSLWYSFRDRRVRKRDLRKLWIARINAAARTNGINYSQFIAGLKRSHIELDRKVLAEIAVSDPGGFKAVIDAIE